MAAARLHRRPHRPRRHTAISTDRTDDQLDHRHSMRPRYRRLAWRAGGTPNRRWRMIRQRRSRRAQTAYGYARSPVDQGDRVWAAQMGQIANTSVADPPQWQAMAAMAAGNQGFATVGETGEASRRLWPGRHRRRRRQRPGLRLRFGPTRAASAATSAVSAPAPRAVWSRCLASPAQSVASSAVAHGIGGLGSYGPGPADGGYGPGPGDAGYRRRG
jgi:hypothetical protein